MVFAERRSTVGSSVVRKAVRGTCVRLFLFFEARASSFSVPRVSPRPFSNQSLFHANNKKMNSHNSLETHHANVQLVSRFGKDVFDIFLKKKCMKF